MNALKKITILLLCIIAVDYKNSYAAINYSRALSGITQSITSINYPALLQGLVFQGAINKVMMGSFGVQYLLISTLLGQAIQLAPIDKIMAKIPYFGTVQQAVTTQVTKIPGIGSQLVASPKSILASSAITKATSGQWNLYGNTYAVFKNIFLGLILQRMLTSATNKPETSTTKKASPPTKQPQQPTLPVQTRT
jgi:hypothetical protein